MSPQRIQRRRTKGWRMPEGAVNVTRPCDWSNPFRVGDHVAANELIAGPRVTIDRPLAVALFRAYATEAGWQTQIREELAGRDLACWCPIEDADGNRVPCHADVLLEIANGEGRVVKA